MSNRARIVRDNTLDEWAEMLDRFDEPTQQDVAQWRRVTERFFGRSQMHVHIISGRLKASGRTETHEEGKRIVGTVTYGGTPGVNYAKYEFAKHGHDPLLPAFKETHREFVSALHDILKRKAQ